MIKGITRKNGLTMIETLMSIGIAVIIIVGMAAAATFAIKFNALSNAKNLAQEVARNAMNQEVRNVKFDTFQTFMGTADEGRIFIFDGTKNPVTTTTVVTSTEGLKSVKTKAKPSATSGLTEDLLKLHNARCAMIITPVLKPDGSKSTSSFNVKLKVWWDLADNGTETAATRNVELLTIVSDGDFSGERYVMSRPSVGIMPAAGVSTTAPTTGPTSTALPTSCTNTSGRDLGCSCTSNGQCASLNCTTLFCTVSVTPTGTPTPGPTAAPTPTPAPTSSALVCLAVNASCVGTSNSCCSGLTCTPIGLCLDCSTAKSDKFQAGCACTKNGDCQSSQCGLPGGILTGALDRCL
jgi:hypothetical protein